MIYNKLCIECKVNLSCYKLKICKDCRNKRRRMLYNIKRNDAKYMALKRKRRKKYYDIHKNKKE